MLRELTNAELDVVGGGNIQIAQTIVQGNVFVGNNIGTVGTNNGISVGQVQINVDSHHHHHG
jgi:hypothetical protein